MLNSVLESDLQESDQFFAPANGLQCSTQYRKVINSLHQQTCCNAQLSAGKWSTGKWSILCTSKRFAMLNSVQESDQFFAQEKRFAMLNSVEKSDQFFAPANVLECRAIMTFKTLRRSCATLLPKSVGVFFFFFLLEVKHLIVFAAYTLKAFLLLCPVFTTENIVLLHRQKKKLSRELIGNTL